MNANTPITLMQIGKWALGVVGGIVTIVVVVYFASLAWKAGQK